MVDLEANKVNRSIKQQFESVKGTALLDRDGSRSLNTRSNDVNFNTQLASGKNVSKPGDENLATAQKGSKMNAKRMICLTFNQSWREIELYPQR